MLKLLTVASLFLAVVLAACPGGPPVDGGDDVDAGIDVQEGEGDAPGGEGEGELVSGEGEGEGDVGGEGEGEGEGDIGGEGEGELVGDVYTGTSEDGVVCGDNICGAGIACCGQFDFMGAPPPPPTCATSTAAMCMAPGGFAITLACDGPEDCTDVAAPVCCGGIAQGGAGCVASDGCSGQGSLTLCVTSADCGAGIDCCSSDQVGMVGVDAGVCTPPQADGRRCVVGFGM
jgi:hypothetical protein